MDRAVLNSDVLFNIKIIPKPGAEQVSIPKESISNTGLRLGEEADTLCVCRQIPLFSIGSQLLIIWGCCYFCPAVPGSVN